jgi:hypothetical protein
MEKRADYASDEDPYSNFRGGNDIVGVENWQRAMSRNLEKFARRANIMRKGGEIRAKDDPFTDSAFDSINLIHIEYGLELESLPNGEKLLKEMYKAAEGLPELLGEFMKKAGIAEDIP